MSSSNTPPANPPVDPPVNADAGNTDTGNKTEVDFGYQKVSAAQKPALVNKVFASVASKYDLMNDLMSLGSHRVFKRMVVQMSSVREGHTVLDLAGGTGDLSALFAPKVGATGKVVLADPNADMMRVGRDRLLDAGITQVDFCRTKGEALPFADNTFDCTLIGFGIRNFTSKEAALVEIERVLKPGGTLLILEFSKPQNPALELAYNGFQALWPAAGRVITGDAQPYQYLVESIRTHPNQKALKLMIQDAGFHNTEYHNLLGGIAAIHRAEKSS